MTPADVDPRVAPETVIDIHCHVMSEGAEAVAGRTFPVEREPFARYSGRSGEYNRELFELIRPKLVDPRSRIDDMDRMGVDVQAISVAPPQYFYWTEAAIGIEATRVTNDRVASIVSEYPDRFVGLGTLALQDIDASLDELERMSSVLAFRGVEICTQVNGVDLDDARFEPLFSEIEARGMLVVVHPNGTTQGERLTDYYLINVVGMPLDSTVFLARMIFGGMLHRHPSLKMCIVHGGGYAASYPARFDHAYRVRPECREHIDRPPSAYLKRLYFDTMVYDTASLTDLVDRYGADHVLLGTDYPYDMAEDDPVRLVRSLGVSTEEEAKILGGNAARLLASPHVDRSVKEAQAR